MRRITFRSLWEHKRRLISTVVAVLLGVAFLSGTFVFSDTLNRALDDLFADGWENVDARVQGEVLFESDFGDQRALLDQALVDAVREVDGVAAAEPYVTVEGFGPNNRVLDPEGEPVGVDQGPPTIFESWVDNDLFDYRLTDGSRPPEADDEVALDVGAAEDAGYSVGDTVTIASQFGPAEYTLVGTFTFGERDSLGGIVAANFTLAETQRLAGVDGQINYVLAAAEEGLSQEELVERIRPAVPAASEVLTGEEAAAEDADAVQEGLAFFNQVLGIFGTIALVVATFLIANTFQILVAQRTRELALLRAVGASKAQVLASVLIESLVIGLVAAVLGLIAGVGLAAGITALLSGLGIDLPTDSLVIRPNTVLVGLAVGLLVTMVSAVAPAVRATRVPPLAAMREVATEKVGASRVRTVLAVVVLALGAFNLSQAWGADGDTDVLPTVGFGALFLLAGVILLGPAVAAPSVRRLGAFLPRLRGVTGRLAVENAARAPKRTSATASALVIAVALVGFITIFAESAKRSVSAEVERGLTADLVVQPSGGAFGGFGGFSPEVARTVAGIDGVELVAAVSFDVGRITLPDGDTTDTFISAVDPGTFDVLADVRMEEGELTDLTPGGILVDRQIADDEDVAVGDRLHLTAAGGELDLEVRGISDDQMMLGIWSIHTDDYAAVSNQRLDFQVFAVVADGADVQQVKAQVAESIDAFPGIQVLDRDEFIGDLADQLTAFVNVIYGLLALSIVIAMIGVANTLALSVHERTRELGLLRAVGMTRSQLRSAIRWEAVIIALLGTVAGLVLGLIASYALVKALEGFGLTRFAVPFGTVLVQVVIAGGLAVLASVFTARRAARLDVLAAIAED